MKEKETIEKLRHVSRILVRELGILQLNQGQAGKTPPHWHALIEINQTPGITIKALSEILVLSFSATSRVTDALVKKEMVDAHPGLDKREKRLYITDNGKKEIQVIDEFSNRRIEGALALMKADETKQLLNALEKYTNALKANRAQKEVIKILTLPSSRTIRKQVRMMIEKIQMQEFSIPITEEINLSIIKAEETYHFNGRCNFWYATNTKGEIIGSIGLKMINKTAIEIKKMFVSTEYRGKGVAHKLLLKAVLAAEKNGCKTVYLGTVSVLKAAHRFYTKLGFVRISKTALPKKFEICPVDSIFFKGNLSILKSRLKISRQA